MNELSTISALLDSLGFSLDKVQPYISGERYLMAGGKLVLAGSITRAEKSHHKDEPSAGREKGNRVEKRPRTLCARSHSRTRRYCSLKNCITVKKTRMSF